MTILVIGLVLFLGVHSIRIFGESWRRGVIAGKGEGAYKGLYSVVSGVGLALLIWGYGLSRASPIEIWNPPTWTRHVAGLLMLVSFGLLLAAYVPGSRLKARLHHPMVLSVKVWAFAHLLANGRLGDIVLFGAFLAWAVLNFRAARARDRTDQVRYKPGAWSRDALIWVLALALWWFFARVAHGWLFGVNPFPI